MRKGPVPQFATVRIAAKGLYTCILLSSLTVIGSETGRTKCNPGGCRARHYTARHLRPETFVFATAGTKTLLYLRCSCCQNFATTCQPVVALARESLVGLCIFTWGE